jgi:hypothetical protein
VTIGRPAATLGHIRLAAAAGLLMLAAACGIEQAVPNPAQPPLPDAVDVDIQYANHSSAAWSLLYFEHNADGPADYAPAAGSLVEPCRALGGAITLHPPFRVYLVRGSLEETRAFETVQDLEAAGISPVLDSATVPLRGATQRYDLDIQPDGSRTIAVADQQAIPRDVC